jgi:hypothetical protein
MTGRRLVSLSAVLLTISCSGTPFDSQKSELDSVATADSGGELVGKPDVVATDVGPADLAQPDVVAPDVGLADLALPDLVAPDIEPADLAQPDVVAPDVGLADLALPDIAADALCASACADKECGDDGCGGSCGECDDYLQCDAGQCVEGPCVPDCANKECGDDSCGGTCGTCGPNESCQNSVCFSGKPCDELIQCSMGCIAESGVECLLDCLDEGPPEAQDKFFDLVQCILGECGMNLDAACMLGAMNGACQEEYQACQDCLPGCTNKQCGDDGCGGSCGECDDADACTSDSCAEGTCVYTPGPVDDQDVCTEDSCDPLTGENSYVAIECDDSNECTDDSCDPLTGCSSVDLPDSTACPGGAQNKCVDGECVCVPQCGEAECGADGCGGSCGECAQLEYCVEGSCVGCNPVCDGKECGADGCGGSCGKCEDLENCVDGTCEYCTPSFCNGEECKTPYCDGEECESQMCICEPACDIGELCRGGSGCHCEPGWFFIEWPNVCGPLCGKVFGCLNDYVCEGNSCVCKPECKDALCGTNGCVGACGYCTDPKKTCSMWGTCKCNGGNCPPPNCGSSCYFVEQEDGYGNQLWGGHSTSGTCGTCMTNFGDGWFLKCSEEGECVCDEKDVQKECADHGYECGIDWGGVIGDCSCGDCPEGKNCVNHHCVQDSFDCPADKDCTGLDCGPDPVCWESCGKCEWGTKCHAGKCHDCPVDKDCTGLGCGYDPICGELCGTCSGGKSCQAGKCINSGGSWTDPTSGLSWQVTPTGFMEPDDAKTHCADLSLDGGGWHLPTINELRTLIRGCAATEDGGNCNIGEGDCLSSSCLDDSCNGCSIYDGPAEGYTYSPDEVEGFWTRTWSSSPNVSKDGFWWTVRFLDGSVGDYPDWHDFFVRCVR